MKRFNLLIIVLLISVLSQSCREDIDIIDINPPEIPPVSKVVSSIQGSVTDDNGNLVSGALVTMDDETVETDENGVFQFLNKKMNKNGAFVSVKKDGYFNGSRRLYPSTGSTSLINIELLTLEIVGEFNYNSKAPINHEGVFLDFPANAIVREDGSDYTGTVSVAIAYLDPTNLSTLDQMPGDLSGISSDGGLVALKSLGMIGVELMDEVGNKLQIKDGNTVDVTIPIPSDLQASAPTTIPMWHFNEATGIWEEEGFASLVGNNYKTSLAHFSFWNCDIPMDYVFMKGSLVNRGVPLQGVSVVIEDLNTSISGYGVTDENGMFCGYIPGGEELQLTVYNQCGEVIYTTTIGPFDEDVILDPINLNIFVDFASISGTATYCDGELSEFAYVILKTEAEIYSFPILDDGTFSGNIFYCGQLQEITISAFDPVNGYSSGDYNFEVEGDIEVGNIELCDIGFVEHIIVEYGDEEWNLIFGDQLINIFSFTTDVINLGDEGFILKSVYEPEVDSIHLFKFYMAYVEGNPIQQCIVQHVKPSGAGNGASGLCSIQLVTQDGVEYLLASGSISGNSISPTLDNEPIYFDILIKNQ